MGPVCADRSGASRPLQLGLYVVPEVITPMIGVKEVDYRP